MICSVHSVNLDGGYALVSVIKAFCPTAMNGVGGVVVDIDPHFATTYNNCRITTKKYIVVRKYIICLCLALYIILYLFE